LRYKLLNEYTNFDCIEGFNPKTYFINRFHHEILIIDNFIIDYHIDYHNPFTIEIKLNDNDNNCIISKILVIDSLNSYFLDKKCVTTIFNIEYNLIPPWVEYHKKIGFEKFIIYNNDQNDDNYFNITRLYTLIREYINDVFIIKANWNYWVNSYGNNPVGQCIQQNHCIWKYSPQFLLLTDLDEYVNTQNNYNLFDKNKSIISIPNWYFGCNNKVKFNNFNLIEKLTKKMKNPNKTANRKCIIQSQYVDLFCVHCPVFFNNNIIYLDYNECYLNHYLTISYKKRSCDCTNYCQLEDKSINKNIDICVILNGGLGNQLFQIASIYSLARIQGANFYTTSMNNNNVHSNNDYSKSIFRKIKCKEKQYITFEEPRQLSAWKMTFPTFYHNIRMVGYFQNEKYFSNYRDEILTMFEIESYRYSYLSNKYKNLNNGFFIHFRRGDYVNNSYYEVLDNYYEKAFEIIQDKKNFYYILSDDIEYCKQLTSLNNFLCNKEYNYIVDEDEINSLYIMSLCVNGGIAANSTFSWWGGYLNQNPDKIVIYPRKWYHNNDYIDIWWKGSTIL
jgi:hypothetical protein